MWHGVIGDDQFPLLIVQRRNQRSRGFHALVDDVESAAPQFAQKQGCVIFGVLNHQNAKRYAHLLSPYRRPFVEDQPVQSQLADGINELSKVDGLAYIAVCTQIVSTEAVLLFIRRGENY